MLKWLLLIFIIPSLLFGKLYSAEMQGNNSHDHMETYCDAEKTSQNDQYLHTHEHDHDSDVSSHAHSHVHFTKTFNPTDSYLFFMVDDNLIPSLNNHIIANIDIFIPSNIIQDLFRPPIA